VMPISPHSKMQLSLCGQYSAHFLFFGFYEIRGHNNCLNLFLPDHPPEISDRGKFWSLGGDISFRMTQTVYVIRVYVIVRSHAVHFLKDYSRVIICQYIFVTIFVIIFLQRPSSTRFFIFVCL
jgi:hypothetical protein